MKHKSFIPIEKFKNWRIAALVAAVLITACGDGGGNNGSQLMAAPVQPAEQAAATSLRIEGHLQAAPAAAKSVLPIEKRAAHAAPEAARIALGELASEKSADTTLAGGMRQIGAARKLERTATAAATQAQLQWESATGGGKVAALSFAAEGAKGLRLGLLIGKLPGGSILRFYRQSDRATAFRISGQQVLQIIERNLDAGDQSDAARTWWSPDLGGDELTFEIEIPADAPPEAVEISVPALSHIFVDLSLPERGAEQPNAVGDASSCNLDATCYPAYSSVADAVARMTFVENGVSYQCTGTLLNNRMNDSTPYFLSANHCISDQTTASTLTTDWFFRSPSCNARTLSSARTIRYGGAQLLHASATTDTAFLLLNDAPPVNANFAGWDASAPLLGASVAGLHHSRGDLLKISFGSIQNYAACTAQDSQGSFSCLTSGSSAPFVRTKWISGTTEPGASGSPLFSSVGSSRYLVGTLRGGNTSCLSTSGQDTYGRFDTAFESGLKKWLDPASTGPGPVGRSPVYRFYNAGSQAHFYTLSAAERDFVIANGRSFAYEGVAFYAYGAPVAGQSPVYRFYNLQSGAHFYTIDAAERDYVLTLPAFRYEGTGWFAQPESGNGATPIYRFYKPARGTHFYTINGSERNTVIDNYKDLKYEGIVYYGWTGGN